jgi:hypothetical protein
LNGAILRNAATPAGVRYASIQEFKRRINVVKSVEKITASMKMVAAAKLKIAQQRVEPAVAFNRGTARMFEGLVADEAEAAVHTADLAATAPKSGSKHLVRKKTTKKEEKKKKKIIIKRKKKKKKKKLTHNDNVGRYCQF